MRVVEIWQASITLEKLKQSRSEANPMFPMWLAYRREFPNLYPFKNACSGHVQLSQRSARWLTTFVSSLREPRSTPCT